MKPFAAPALVVVYATRKSRAPSVGWLARRVAVGVVRLAGFTPRRMARDRGEQLIARQLWVIHSSLKLPLDLLVFFGPAVVLVVWALVLIGPGSYPGWQRALYCSGSAAGLLAAFVFRRLAILGALRAPGHPDNAGRCEACGYDARGLEGNCPECGAEIPTTAVVWMRR